MAGIFVHERFHDKDIKKFEGWWGNKGETRFDLKTKFDSSFGASSFQLSNPSIFAMIPILSSLNLFEEATMKKLRSKSKYLTSYLEILLDRINEEKVFFKILTPRDPNQRGCQLSLEFDGYDAQELTEIFLKNNCEVDDRKPNVIRVSPTPLYNSFNDVYKFYSILLKFLIK
jgi:kynureninase